MTVLIHPSNSNTSVLNIHVSFPLPLIQEANTEYSHLEPLPEHVDEDSPYEELGDVEANDLLNFAYQIASGMVSHRVKGHCDQSRPSSSPFSPSLLFPPSLPHVVYRST